jgi:hypothetical protein
MLSFQWVKPQVRQKMLQASSKAGLLKALGEGRFKESMFFTSPVRFHARLSTLLCES